MSKRRGGASIARNRIAAERLAASQLRPESDLDTARATLRRAEADRSNAAAADDFRVNDMTQISGMLTGPPRR